MINKFKTLLFLLTFKSFASLPEGFVYLKDIAPEIKQSVRYFSNENFTGEKLKGYEAETIIITKSAAIQLKKVNADLQKEGFTLVVYDGYRPQMAVEAFIAWSQTKNAIKKNYYYPDLSKTEIFKRGFVAKKSAHSRGSTVDLTIIKNGTEICPIKIVSRETKVFLDDCTLDMGMHWDFFGEESWSVSSKVSQQFNERRKLLRNKMKQYNFKSAEGEWWHFTLQDEPFPDTYFNFTIQ